MTVPTAAQEYPARAVTVIVSLSAGGLSDIVARVFAQELHKKFGQPFVVENRPGGNGLNGARSCAQAKPDGYTVCIVSSDPLVWNALLPGSQPFDADKSLQPVTGLFYITVALGVHPSLKVNSLTELVSYSKANPGKLSYATASSISSFFLEQVKRETGADMVGVPFKGAGEAINSLVSGHTQLGLMGLGNFAPYLSNDQIVPLAIDGDKRLATFPNIPTFREAGYNGERTRSWLGLFAPAGTPPDIVQKINAAVREIGARPEIMQNTFYQRGLEPALTSSEDFVKEIERDRDIAGRMVKAAGTKSQ